MSRELDILANEYKKKPATVIRKDVNLYGTNIQNATSSFLRSVEQECKRDKQSNFTLLVVIPEKNS
jgi:hypothetical protein